MERDIASWARQIPHLSPALPPPSTSLISPLASFGAQNLDQKPPDRPARRLQRCMAASVAGPAPVAGAGERTLRLSVTSCSTWDGPPYPWTGGLIGVRGSPHQDYLARRGMHVCTLWGGDGRLPPPSPALRYTLSGGALHPDTASVKKVGRG